MIDYTVEQGVARITWDMPGRAMNVLNAQSLPAFDAAVERAISDDSVKGVIIDSAKADFIAGADLEMLMALETPSDIQQLCDQHKARLRALETSGKPFVAAVNGHALGGGLEICLACHYRVAVDNEVARIGLPEVTLGLLPGAGGTQRLPRMIGLDKALPLLVEGKTLSPSKAAELGIIDEVVPAHQLLDAARAWIEVDGRCDKPWYDKGYRAPGPAVQSPKGYEIFTTGTALLHGKTRGNYPAPHAIMACVYQGMQLPIDTALALESKYIAKLFASRETKSMIRSSFFSMNEAKKLTRRPAGIEKADQTRIGVLGAGMMGAAIAYVSALSGLEVVVLDTTLERAENGHRYGSGVMEKMISRGRMTETDRDDVLRRITPVTEFAALSDCQLVIEAVFEDRALKAEVTRKTEAVVDASAVFASNTSTLPITGLAESSARPENFIGLHFFSPVDRMQLVEVITGEKTSPQCLAHALDFVKRIRKVPIVVNDSLGFYTSRLVGRFVDEGVAMVGEGISPALIENAGKMAGFPVGPLALADEVSLELMYDIRTQHQRDLGEDYVAQPGEAVLTKFIEDLGRLGRKSGGGFYDYPAGQSKMLWPGLVDHFPRRNSQPDVEEVKQRLLYVQSVDAARCLDEAVLTDPRDGDVGSILGWGFPVYTGGAVSLIDYVGVEGFVEGCDQLAETHGERFAPPDSLRAMAREGRRFYND